MQIFKVRGYKETTIKTQMFAWWTVEKSQIAFDVGLSQHTLKKKLKQVDEVDISALFKKLVDGLVKIFKTFKYTYTFNTLNKFKVCRFGLEFLQFEIEFF